jgi:hypothetical protein
MKAVYQLMLQVQYMGKREEEVGEAEGEASFSTGSRQFCLDCRKSVWAGCGGQSFFSPLSNPSHGSFLNLGQFLASLAIPEGAPHSYCQPQGQLARSGVNGNHGGSIMPKFTCPIEILHEIRLPSHFSCDNCHASEKTIAENIQLG